MKIGRKAALFAIGGSGYVGLELLFRGRSHSSMFLAGGTCMVLVGQLNRLAPRIPFALRSVIGAGMITAVELAVGLAVNRDFKVWDYRQLPGNFMGQICLGFSLLWIPAAALILLIHDPLEEKLCRRKPPAQ